MRTFLLVKLTLLPLAWFWTLSGFGQPGWAIFGGLGLALALGTVALWRGSAGPMQAVVTGLLAVLAAGELAAPAMTQAHALPFSFAWLGAYALLSVALRRPWTAEFSRSEHAGAEGSSLFMLVNAVLSGLWGVLFLAMAACAGLAAPRWLSSGIVVAGALVSIFGPKLMLRAIFNRMSEERWRWEAPSLGGAQGEDSYDVAVVGAGIGGLTAAALLADNGLKVLVVDQHVLPGGFCHTWLRAARHNGTKHVFRFDSGVHDFSGVREGGPVTSVLRRLGLEDRIEWLRLDHRYVTDDGVIDVPRDWRAYAALLGEAHPASAAGILALFEDLRAIFDGMFSTGDQRSGIPGAPASLEAMLEFPRRHPLAMQWMHKPFSALLDKHVREPAARKRLLALAGYLTDQAESLEVAQMAPIFGYYFFGGYYPRGGSGHFADLLADAITERGGRVLLKTAVTRILVEGGRAAGLELANGRRIRAGAVVSNADLRRTYLELLPQEALPAGLRAEMAAVEPSCSAFAVHLALDIVPQMPPMVHVEGKVGIVMPSLIDPSAAPAGYATMELLTLLPHAEAAAWFPPEDAHGSVEEWKQHRRSAHYEARKAALADRLIDAAATVIPDLRQHIVLRTEASPITFARYDWSSAGAIYGVAKPHRHRGVKTPIPGLVVAGAGHSGCGVEAVLISGAMAAAALRPGLLDGPVPAPAAARERELSPA